MKILQVHNQYQYAGGEDAVVQMEADLLRNHNVEVHQWIENNDNISGLTSKISTALTTHYSHSSKQEMIGKLKAVEPNVVHVHNFFPKLSPSIFEACYEMGVPVVLTLHNYRLVCPGALLMRDNIVCEDCLPNKPFNAVKHGCYKNSILGTMAVAYMLHTHIKKHTWEQKVDRFICLTEFAKKKFSDCRFPAEKISVKPNFVDIPFVADQSRMKQALFVGRLSQEKGIHVLLEAWKNIEMPLLVAGDGPLQSEIALSNIHTIKMLGLTSKDDVYALMRQSTFLVMPSIWYEGFPMVLVEAFAHGLPVICSNIGGMAEVVQDGVTGLHFEAGNSEDLAKKISWAEKHEDEMRQMGEKARRMYELNYSPDNNFIVLHEIYLKAIESKQRWRHEAQ